MTKGPLFYAKVLLFGEYGIIKDSMGLSIPYNYYQGAFQFAQSKTEETEDSNRHLQKYLAHLITLNAEGNLIADLDLQAFADDIQNGLFFDSSIPRGFGVGSSGAAGFGFIGISILIASGVSLETMKQIDSQLTMRNYEGFLK